MRTLVVPKVDHEGHLGRIGEEISNVIQSNPELLHQRPEPISIVASIESAQALWKIGEISQWRSKHGRLSALLVRPKWPSVAIYRGLTVTHPSLRLRIVRKTAHAYWLTGTNLPLLTDCADTRIIRTSSLQELLYTRSKIVAAARAFGLDAIDMVGCYSTPRARVGPSLAGPGLR